MASRTSWSAESREALAAVAASVAALAAFTGTGSDGGAEVSDECGSGPLGSNGALGKGAGPGQGAALRDADPLRDLADGCLDGLAELARLEARTAALKVRLAADYIRAATALAAPAACPQEHTAQEMALVAEVACVLGISERAAGALLSESQALTTMLPLTLTALQAGSISWQHARIMVEETTGMGRAGAAGLEAHFLDPAAPNPARGCPAGDLVPSRFRAKARTWRERHHPASIEERHTKSAADRRIEYTPDRDGMTWLSAYLPADTAAGIWDRTTAAARALQGPHEPRTLPQLRADITATWLLTNGTGTGTAGETTDGWSDGTTDGWSDGTGKGGTGKGGPSGGGTGKGGPSGEGTGAGGRAGGGTGRGAVAGTGGGVPSPRAQVLITVPVLSLLGATDEPAILDGYGPIPPSMARRLIAEGADSFHRVLTDPRDGAPLEIGRTSYRLTKAQRQWLRLRDGKCPFPGCNNHSLDNDADHLLAWASGGTTGITNLGQPCPKHHRLKHHSAWTPTHATKNNPPGWTSPTGRHYPSEHHDWEPPTWPHDVPVADTFDSFRLPDQEPDAEPEQFPDQDPGQDPELELPNDPFPDWHSFTEGHLLPATDTADETWPALLNDGPLPKSFQPQCA